MNDASLLIFLRAKCGEIGDTQLVWDIHSAGVYAVSWSSDAEIGKKEIATLLGISSAKGITRNEHTFTIWETKIRRGMLERAINYIDGILEEYESFLKENLSPQEARVQIRNKYCQRDQGFFALRLERPVFEKMLFEIINSEYPPKSEPLLARESKTEGNKVYKPLADGSFFSSKPAVLLNDEAEKIDCIDRILSCLAWFPCFPCLQVVPDVEEFKMEQVGRRLS